MTSSSLSKTPRACGSWPSPLSVEWLTAARRLSFATLHEGCVYWVEGRPEEGGRNVLMRRSVRSANGSHAVAEEITPAPLNVRSRVHEYGGHPFVCAGTSIWFIDDVTQQVMQTDAREVPRPLAKAAPYRLADLIHDPFRKRLIGVGERHEASPAASATEPKHALVTVGLGDGAVAPLCEGHDFYAAPRLDGSGRWLAYITWDHPNMPWDGAALWVAAVNEDGTLAEPRHIAGNGSASAFGPCWSPAGELAFAWERDGHWNLFSWRPGGEVTPLTPAMAAEFALPLWQLGMSTFGWIDEHALMAGFVEEGVWRVGVVDARRKCLDVVNAAWPSLAHLQAGAEGAAVIAAAPEHPSAVLHMAPDGVATFLRTSVQLSPEIAACVSPPEPVTFAVEAQTRAHAFFYAPANAAHEPLPTELPPLLVMAHGGPTAATTASWNPVIQYWTSRGFAVLDVNYRGSTGHGRRFRESLKGLWGVADVHDCIVAAQQMAARQRVDGGRMAIRGSSAGGFTALTALAHGTFAAGASLYGVADLEALVRDTHKFEARYLDALIAPYPERADIYRARSPLYTVDAITAPVIFFQGLEDKVVPPNQTEAMVRALRARNVAVECHMFEGEQHGFRRADTLRKVYAAELAFYGGVFGFAPA